MSGPLERRLSKLEEIRERNGVGSDVDISLKKMGTSRTEMLADFGSLVAFRDWLAGRIAATDRQDEVQQTTSSNYRQWQGDGAVSAKWDAILQRHEALPTAACPSYPKGQCNEFA
ncbi:MAG: hypothetical protein JNK99_16055 [Candidatus Accumulibacter sp.]|uniref:hypothetical protein n=1 Tax=Accumulibacter sp. TaxID=2053492 RepID=UPI001A631864|nr:hypothetical protein [Accumulibacter sp.]MBL8396234.1 hypothetical protein [Accumulibacter sp.]